MSSSVFCFVFCVQGRATSEACTLMASLVPWRLRHWMGLTLHSVELSHVALIPWEGGVLSPQRISPVRRQILALRTGLGVSSWGPSGTTAIPTPEKSKMFQHMLKGGLYRKCLVGSWHVINALGQRGWYFYVQRKCLAVPSSLHHSPICPENCPDEACTQHSCCLVSCMVSPSARPLSLSTQHAEASTGCISVMLGALSTSMSRLQSSHPGAGSEAEMTCTCAPGTSGSSWVN